MIKLSQEEIKEIIAKKYDVSVDDVILYSELSLSGNIIKCMVKANPCLNGCINCDICKYELGE